MPDELISIGEAAELLGVSISTLRRWDESGRFPAIESRGGHRRYSKSQIEIYLQDILAMGKDWALNNTEIPSKFYCSDSSIFKAKLDKMKIELARVEGLNEIYPLIVAVAGEIGGNSFDHNLGNWPDTPGIFFGYDLIKRRVVLADRGRGVLATLKVVRPELNDHREALRVAFTEVLSGRAPENRGNGLKFVRKVVTKNLIGLIFQTGNAELELEKDNSELQIRDSGINLRGCLATLNF